MTRVPPDRLAADAFEPVKPAYGTGSLADLLPSAAAALGVPGAADVLGLRSLTGGADRIAVLLVDGLGAYQKSWVAEIAPILTDLDGPTLTSGFPSTTPVSLATLGAGVPPGEHGILGFTVRRPGGRVVNHIHWGDDPDPLTWQPVPTVLQRAVAAGVPVTVVSRPEFEGSGLTVATQRGGAFRGTTDIAGTASAMLAALAEPGLVYGYHGDLDKAGHEAGVGSDEWIAAAAGVGDLVERLVSGLPPGAALLITADHGQVNIPMTASSRIEMSPDMAAGVIGVAGEPRVRYLHVAPGAQAEVIAAWQSAFGAGAWVLSRDEVIDGGWFGPVAPAHAGRIGDIVVICQGRTISLAADWEPPAVARLIAYHGSVTAAEMTVPLLIARP